MPIVTQCAALGCETLTMGPFCVEHEPERPAVLVRGRPWPTVARAAARPERVSTPQAGLLAQPAWARRRRSPQPVAAP